MDELNSIGSGRDEQVGNQQATYAAMVPLRATASQQIASMARDTCAFLDARGIRPVPVVDGSASVLGTASPIPFWEIASVWFNESPMVLEGVHRRKRGKGMVGRDAKKAAKASGVADGQDFGLVGDITRRVPIDADSLCLVDPAMWQQREKFNEPFYSTGRDFPGRRPNMSFGLLPDGCPVIIHYVYYDGGSEWEASPLAAWLKWFVANIVNR